MLSPRLRPNSIEDFKRKMVYYTNDRLMSMQENQDGEK